MVVATDRPGTWRRRQDIRISCGIRVDHRLHSREWNERERPSAHSRDVVWNGQEGLRDRRRGTNEDREEEYEGEKEGEGEGPNDDGCGGQIGIPA